MLKLDKICVSFRRECQDKLFGHTKQQVLFDVSAEVKKEPAWGFWENPEVENLLWAGCYADF